MKNKLSYSAEELPFAQLQKVGLSKKNVLDMPKEVLEKLLTGQMTPVVELKMEREDGRKLFLPVKLKLDRDEKTGKAVASAILVSREMRLDNNLLMGKKEKQAVQNLKLSEDEKQRLKRGEVVFKNNVPEKDAEGRIRRTSVFVEMEKDTKSIMLKKSRDIEIPNAIKGIELGMEQKKNLREGKPIQVEIGDQKITAGVDLSSPTGFNMMNGDLMQWQRKKEQQWDFFNPGAAMYLMTDQNKWELKETMSLSRYNKMERTQQVSQSVKQEVKQERKEEQRHSSGRHR